MLGPIDPWIWGQDFTSKCQEPIAYWYSVVSQKNVILRAKKLIVVTKWMSFR